MVNTVGFRKAERLLIRGELLQSDQALAYGLVDEVCPAADVLPAAERELRALLSVDHQVAPPLSLSAVAFDRPPPPAALSHFSFSSHPCIYRSICLHLAVCLSERACLPVCLPTFHTLTRLSLVPVSLPLQLSD
jgi:hypothetical protein